MTTASNHVHALRKNILMEIVTSAEFRNRALTLLKIERIQFNEQMVLLGYKEEKAAPIRRGRLIRRLSPVDRLCTNHGADSLPL